jgi:F-type H+-transporting ATPase subunit b
MASTTVHVFLATDGEEAVEGEAEVHEEEHHANNFFYGDINEVIWGSVAFAIIFALFLWKGLPAIKRAMAKRTAGIETQIASAEQARATADADLVGLRSSLSNVDAEAAAIVTDARERAEVLKVDLKARGEAHVHETVQRARIEVEASKTQALADLREEVVNMTTRATEAILAENLTATVQSDLVDRYIDQVGTSR